ncbi:hypothetical protein [Duganella levis]|uniref:Uncharacterized protein n=1 Tax=Duganella levis TaxID=2692169 RepID=A0ABW9VYW7_9BURK|nr:hypothetical protein [Duganella levis]MYN26851.1 hypothetical protein [Duganella levis]
MNENEGSHRTSPWVSLLKTALKILVTWLLLALFAYVMFLISRTLDCEVNEGGTNPCYVHGIDIQALVMIPAMLVAFGAPLFLLGVGVCISLAAGVFLMEKIFKK